MKARPSSHRSHALTLLTRHARAGPKPSNIGRSSQPPSAQGLDALPMLLKTDGKLVSLIVREGKRTCAERSRSARGGRFLPLLRFAGSR